MKKIQINNIRKILIRSANWVGDAVMSLPTIRAIRRNFPDAEISILVKAWVSPLFDNNPDIDHILLYDSVKRHKGWLGKFRLSNDLREKRFDLAILLQNAFEAALITWMAGIPNRLGYNTDARTLLLTHPVKRNPEYKTIHQIDYYLGILEGASLKTYGKELSLIISQEEQIHAKEILKNQGITGERPLIGINPGAAYGNAKRWYPECFADLCKRLQNFCKADIIILGGPGEELLGKQICSMIGKNCISLCGKTSLREAIALIERFTLFITNDSGLMHIAAAIDTPQIAIFGPTNQITTSPASLKSLIISVPTPCSPCLKPECPEKHHSCMKAVTVDMVYNAAISML